MKTIQVNRREINPADYQFRDAKESDYKTLIKEDCTIINNENEIVAIYLTLTDKETKQIRQHIQSVQCKPDRRSKGLIVNAAVFGYTPRKTISRDYCSSAMLSHNNPTAHAAICDFGKTISKYYKKYVPNIFQQHATEVQAKVKDDWIIEGTPFTSGIVNHNSPLRYHFDTGNFKNVYSNMLALTYGIKGGHLALPEYNIGLEIGDNSILLFDGQKILHGVTPIHRISKDAYRYTIVFYTLQKMWKCETPVAELNRIKRVKTDRELRRYKMLKGEIPKVI